MGPSQVWLRGECEPDEAASRYDIMYLENISLVLDLKILLFTIRTVLRREGK